MCFAFWSQNEQPNIVYLHLNQLLLKCFMALLQTLTSNLSDLHLLKPTVLVPLQKSGISHIQCELLSEPAWFCQWKQNHSWTTLVIWLCALSIIPPPETHKRTRVLPSCNLWKDVKVISVCSTEPELTLNQSKAARNYLCMPLTLPDNS